LAIAANQDAVVVDGLVLQGVSTFAKSKSETTFNGLKLSEIVKANNTEPIWQSAKMAGETLMKKIQSELNSSSTI